MGSCLICAGAMLAISASVSGATTAGSLPIREVTVFKDGHAMVLREGEMLTNEQGDVVLDELPQPVLGTFWAYEDEADAELRSVKASRLEVENSRQPENIRELILANIGQKISWGRSGETDEATILGLLVPSLETGDLGQERLVTSASDLPIWSMPESKSIHASIGSMTVLMQYDDGATRAIAIERFNGVLFETAPNTEPVIRELVQTERMTIDLEWDSAPQRQADIGLMYLQRGLRWIPSYRITMLGNGMARIELQATLINELAALDDVSCNLVIGVPRFEFEHTLDPMAMSDVMASLGPYFQAASSTGRGMSVALRAQSARMSETTMIPKAGIPPTVELGESGHAEDLYIFAANHITLNVGERMTLPINSFEAPYESIYKLNLPIDPPLTAYREFKSHQKRKLAELSARPQAEHVLRITNSSEHPITTAPALIVQDNGMPLAQGMLTYTSSGATADLEVTTAVDLQVEIESEEIGDRAEAVKTERYSFFSVELENTCVITNRKTEPVRVEVRAFSIGAVDQANENAKVTKINVFVEASLYPDLPDEYAWWRWWSWPWWWTRLNTASRIEWAVEIEPGEAMELHWLTHYFWQV